MRDTVARDFSRIPGVEVVTYPDQGYRCSLQAMLLLASDCDWSMVIAPEIDGILSESVEFLLENNCPVLAPSNDAIALTSNKLQLANHWREHGVRTPATSDREPSECEAFPLVWKPRDGAGSTDTFLLQSAFDLARARAERQTAMAQDPMILQEYVEGTSASVAILCGPLGNVPLVPAYQLLSRDGRFKYQGGELPIPSELAARAVGLARRAVDCVTGLLGYIGVDLVLGEDADRDYAIEINPRLTTSYVGLRALADFNIAEAVLRTAKGQPLEALKWKKGRIRFGPEGNVQKL
jgi:predicted ATP-grasp superfamily ATP-dependent carboligase